MIDELLAPLAPEDPRDDEIATLLARADRRTKRRRHKLAAATAFTAIAVTATLAALPSSDPAPATAAALLRTTAAVAAEQPQPKLAPWTGFRYVQQVETRTQDGYTTERTEEIWTDSRWQGVRDSAEGKLVDGRFPTAEEQRAIMMQRLERSDSPDKARARKLLETAQMPDPRTWLAARRIETPKMMPNLYGDGALAQVPLSELPTDPNQLGALLIDAHRDGRWTPGGSWNLLEADVKYDVLRDIILLLTQANTTAAQRAALITVLSNYEGATLQPAMKDHRGREGRGVDIPTGRATVRVIFAPDTSELLEWSEPNEIHTYLASGQVERLGDRP